MRGATDPATTRSIPRAASKGRLGSPALARQMRTNIEEEGGLWRADAVYSNSPALPRGLGTIGGDATGPGSAQNGIPTV
ncbi:hypothetical protein OCH239_02925 [Roseivivax halodurans JCM 10272]|uniref:Uncharacterized protein n=1 Tax=Roseivivax halodurans JCM 10272 TaxID=1449350 RepID=X7EF94_9RHOB|nr:hypothetical protein OCH239_02925 [Roseivivax halodurans JCM 10272]